MNPNPLTRRTGRCLIMGAIALLTLYTYLDIRDHQFLSLDDEKYVADNIRVKQGLTAAHVAWALTSMDAYYWQPVTWISHMAVYGAFGDAPSAHLLLNLIIHVINAMLLYSIIQTLSGSPGKAAMVALVFALHPLNVESVAWLSERKTVLSTFFLLAALSRYIQYAGERTLRRYCSGLVLYALGLMSKPIILTFPFLLLLLDCWPLKRLPAASGSDRLTVSPECGCRALFRPSAGRDGRLLLWEKVPFLLLSVASFSLSILSVYRFDHLFQYTNTPMSLRLSNFLVSIILYVRDMFWPFSLTVFYPFPHATALPQVLVAASLVVGMTLFSIGMRKRRPWITVGWLWFLITLLPASGLIQTGIWPSRADRFMYIPMIGLTVSLLWEVDRRIKGRFADARKGIACLCIILYLIPLARLQIQYFSDSYMLFRRNIDVTGGNFLAFNGMGRELLSHRQIDDAAKYFRQAFLDNPRYDVAYHNYGVCLFLKGEFQQAYRYFSRSLALNPYSKETYLNLVKSALALGQLDRAEELLAKALRTNPGDAETRELLNLLREMQALPMPAPPRRDQLYK